MIRGIFHENPELMDSETFASRTNDAIWFINQMSDVIGLGIAKALTGKEKK